MKLRRCADTRFGRNQEYELSYLGWKNGREQQSPALSCRFKLSIQIAPQPVWECQDPVQPSACTPSRAVPVNLANDPSALAHLPRTRAVSTDAPHSTLPIFFQMLTQNCPDGVLSDDVADPHGVKQGPVVVDGEEERTDSNSRL